VFYVCDLRIKIHTKFIPLIQVVIIKMGILLNLKSLFDASNFFEQSFLMKIL